MTRWRTKADHKGTAVCRQGVPDVWCVFLRSLLVLSYDEVTGVRYSSETSGPVTDSLPLYKTDMTMYKGTPKEINNSKHHLYGNNVKKLFIRMLEPNQHDNILNILSLILSVLLYNHYY